MQVEHQVLDLEWGGGGGTAGHDEGIATCPTASVVGQGWGRGRSGKAGRAKTLAEEGMAGARRCHLLGEGAVPQAHVLLGVGEDGLE